MDSAEAAVPSGSSCMVERTTEYEMQLRTLL